MNVPCWQTPGLPGQYKVMYDELRNALAAVKAWQPNGRDYQSQDGLLADQRTRRNMIAQLSDMVSEVESVLMEI